MRKLFLNFYFQISKLIFIAKIIFTRGYDYLMHIKEWLSFRSLLSSFRNVKFISSKPQRLFGRSKLLHFCCKLYWNQHLIRYYEPTLKSISSQLSYQTSSLMNGGASATHLRVIILCFLAYLFILPKVLILPKVFILKENYLS